jgi:heme oxygenase (biliverdin-IX-beta and delta-forming)
VVELVRNDLLALLRQQTAAEHRCVETHPLLRPLTDEHLTLDACRRVLEVFVTFFRALEPSVVAGSSRYWGAATYRYLPRLPLLEQDLVAINAGNSRACEPEEVTGIDDPGQLLGVLYILEGATQGGKVIAPLVQRTLGLDITRGNSYFHLHQSRSREAFRHLAGRSALCYDSAAVVAGARATFNQLHAILDAHLLTP